MSTPVNILAERDALENAPRVEPGPVVGRCHWCGRLARTLTPIETVGGVERAKGECCT